MAKVGAVEYGDRRENKGRLRCGGVRGVAGDWSRSVRGYLSVWQVGFDRLC